LIKNNYYILSLFKPPGQGSLFGSFSSLSSRFIPFELRGTTIASIMFFFSLHRSQKEMVKLKTQKKKKSS